MKWNLAASLFALCVVELHAPAPADACGVKLTVKSSAPRKAVARTSNPSEVLLVGNPSRRLERDLAAAGHKVEVAPNPGAAKRTSYAVVIVDAEMEGEARNKFGGSVVTVRSGDTVADIRSVEKGVARKPVRVDESRVALRAREAPTPLRTGPEREPARKIVGAADPAPKADPVPPAPVTPAVTPRVAATKPKPDPKPDKPAELKTSVDPKPTIEPKVVDKPDPKPVVVDKPTPDPKPRAVAKAVKLPELHFVPNSAKTGAASLAKAVRYLTDHADVQVTVEGHADPTGNPDLNMVLAQKRAEWVRDQLVAGGIDQSRIEVISYGDTRLKYSRSDGRNRRVEIVAK